MHRLARLTAAGLGGLALLCTGLPAAASASAENADAVFDAHTVTLITGDVVTVGEAGGGRRAVSVAPGAGREGMRFLTAEEGGELRVTPSDMVPYLAEGRLDPQLFSVTDLIEQGYDDAASKTLPLIVTHSGGKALPGVVASLESVDGHALVAKKASLPGLWTSLAGGTSKIWLDAKVKASLDQSVPQIGAPEAWQAGFDGKGVKVAVLDTGVDETHPDLAGKVTQTKVFTGEPSVKDGHGHGTHVASTIAGRKGVAPGAELLVGKVLNDEGEGSFSAIIEAMEWAVGQGAAAVNLSLGGDATDGTDPLSVAVDTLTETSGTLFVVAAGNEGREYSVGTPGAATSALTVGAVDRSDALADFSSRGPRLDDAPKPDISAPGVGIVAARAVGTAMGQPVDDRYTAASGTSMATPHVAGAVALLKQQHPEWTAVQLKNSLVSSAKTIPGQTVHQQGGGRVDVARAVRQGVTATASLNLGVHQDGQGGNTAEGTVTYTNGTKAQVTLPLSATLTNLDGDQPGEGAITLGAPSVTVEPGGTASVQVRVDLTKLAHGRHGGYLITNDVHTTLALTRKARTHKVHFTGIDPGGSRTGVPVILMNGATRDDDVQTFIAHSRRDEGVTVEVAEGSYLTQAVMGEYGGPHKRASLVVIPELKVDKDLEVALDARTAKPVIVKVAQPVELSGIFTYFTHRGYGSRKITHGVMEFDSVEGLDVTPTQPVTNGSFEFASRWQLAAPRVSARVGAEPYPMVPMASSPEFDGRHRWALADGAAGSRGKVAVISGDVGQEEEAVEAAVQAGAVAVVFIRPSDAVAWQRWNPVNDRLPIPAMLIAADHGQRLLERIRKGRATLEVVSDMSPSYTYDVMQVSSGHIPSQIVHEVSWRNTARVDTTYQDTGGFAWAKEQRYGWRPWQAYSLGNQMETQRVVKTPLRRAEYVSAEGTQWQHIVNHLYTWESMGQLRSGLTEAPRVYRAGELIGERWHAPVVRPAIPAWGPASTRAGDTMTILIPEFVDADGHASRRGVDNDKAQTRLYRDGTLVAEGKSAWGDFPAVPEKATYRLELATSRTSEDWINATSTETVWTFTSKRGQELLPLLQVDYDVRPGLLGFAVRHQSGVTGLAAKDLRVELSSDDGATWKRQAVFPLGHGRFGAVALAKGEVSMRVTAADSAGNQVKQTVIRAYSRS